LLNLKKVDSVTIKEKYGNLPFVSFNYNCLSLNGFGLKKKKISMWIGTTIFFKAKFSFENIN